MATRQDRLLERMRGARMHEVEDISFGFVLPEPEPEAQALEQEAEPDASPAGVPAPPPAARPTPNTSAKRTRPDRSGSRSASTNHTARTTRSRSSAASSPLDAPARTSPTPRPDVYDISEHESSDGARQDSSSAAKRATSGRKSTTRKKQSGLSSGLRRVSLAVLEEDVEMATVPVPSSGSIGSAAKAPDGTLLQRRPQRSGSMAHSPIIREEVGESPADAPGSGRRRPLRLSEDAPVVGSSTLLQRVLEDLDETTAHVPSSSPLQRMVIRRQSGEAERQQRWSVRLSGGSTATGGDEDDELTPDRPRKRDIEVKKATFKPNGEKRARLEPTSAPVEKQPVEELERAAGDADEGDEGDEGEVEDEDTAQEIGDREAAQKLATRKRPRQSLPAPPSPELHSQPPESPEPAPKRRRRKEAASPARQQQPKQPKNKPGKKQAPANKKSGPKAKAKAPNTAADDGDEADGGSVPVTVHRFSKKPQVGEDEPDAGLLNAEIPFANRGGVNAVDVLSKLCEELIAAFLARLEDNVRNAEDAAGRREQRTMLRSLEAFQEELRTRLLEHTIALDTLHSFRKRVRVAQKEKLTLRDEILRVRAERDQVALRMDAIRIQHEAESKEALRRMSLSSAMHDIDLVVERGQAAAELTASEQKEADLANLELMISRLAEQASSKSDGGGTLKQIRDFNAFLERTASVLEHR